MIRRLTPRTANRRRRWVAVTAVLVLALAIAPVIILSAAHTAVRAANHRLTRGTTATLAHEHGSSRLVLLVGDDSHTGNHGGADSVQLVRINGSQPLAFLSLPRDMLVNAPGLGGERVTTLYRENGLPLLVRAIGKTFNLRPEHVLVIHIRGLRQVIDTVGGVQVRVDTQIVSNRFDGRVWRFSAGEQLLTGTRAVAFARTRTNELAPDESDSSRTSRQQLVVDALLSRLSPGTIARHPIQLPHTLLGALATDASLRQLISLARDARAARGHGVLHCKLGGQLAYLSRGAMADNIKASRDGIFLVPDAPSTPTVMAMWKGKRHPDMVTGGAYPAGCTRTRR